MPDVTTLLDLAWVTVAVGGLIALSVCEIRRHQDKGMAGRVVAILLSLVVLFPCLSASDDRIGRALLSSRLHGQEETSILAPSDSLAGMDFELGVQLQALAHSQVASFDPAPPIFPSAAWLATPAPFSFRDTPLLPVSRAPPSV